MKNASDRITLDELNRLIENLKHSESKTDKKIRIGLILQYYTSLRFGDCSDVTFNDIINNNKFEIVETKTKKQKTVTVNPKLKKEVAEYYKTLDKSLADTIIDYSIQYSNRQLKKYHLRFGVKNYTSDSKFKLSTHSIRKCSLYEIYKRAGINVSLKISNHSSIKIHLDYICADEDVKSAYMCL
jgi:integrase